MKEQIRSKNPEIGSLTYSNTTLLINCAVIMGVMLFTD